MSFLPQPIHGTDLNPTEIADAVAALTDPAVPDAEKAAFLRALRAKGETPAEIAGFAAALLDVCGTGGDRLHLFNVSTTASFVLAAGGVAVIKHGNRAITSQSGGSDVLAALGVPLDLAPDALRGQLERVGLGFLFAPRYHPAFAAVAGVRRQLAAEGTSTIFNLLGPLLNPARPAHQLVGVFDPAWTETFAEVLRRLGRRRAWAVHGAGGMDELSTLGATRVSCHEGGSEIVTGTVEPEDAGLTRAENLDVLRGGTPEENARTLAGILRGEIDGSQLDLVLLNAAAGFVVAGLSPDLGAGVERGREAIRSGRAAQVLERMRDGGT